MTKCTFHKFGTSGNIEKHDALCILPLNIGNILHPSIFFLNLGVIFILQRTMWESRATFLHPAGQYRLLPKEGSTQWNHPLCSQRKDLHLHIDLFPLAIFTTIAKFVKNLLSVCRWGILSIALRYIVEWKASLNHLIEVIEGQGRTIVFWDEDTR